MSLVFRNALMPSQEQQGLRLRLVYFMRHWRLYPLLVHDVDGSISWHLKEQLHSCEKEGRSMIPPHIF